VGGKDNGIGVMEDYFLVNEEIIGEEGCLARGEGDMDGEGGSVWLRAR
jgi:hypothetical protein